MMAFAMMAAIRHRANQATPKKTKKTIRRNRARSSAGRSRKSAE
jgi:SRSO17 transposase